MVSFRAAATLAIIDSLAAPCDATRALDEAALEPPPTDSLACAAPSVAPLDEATIVLLLEALAAVGGIEGGCGAAGGVPVVTTARGIPLAPAAGGVPIGADG